MAAFITSLHKNGHQASPEMNVTRGIASSNAHTISLHLLLSLPPYSLLLNAPPIVIKLYIIAIVT